MACNLRALGVGELTVISVIGDDWRGFLLRDCFAKRGIDTGRLICNVTHKEGYKHLAVTTVLNTTIAAIIAIIFAMIGIQ